MSHIPRNTGQRGGGVGIIYKNSLDIRVVSHDSSFSSFEHTEHLLKLCTWIRLIVIYRPPPSSANRLTVAQFLEEFSIFLEYLVLLPADVLIMGDFNFHVDDAMDQDAKEFLTLLDTFNLSQHIVEPTHKYGHTLDLMISKQGASLIKNVNVFLPWISDHSVVQANIMTTKPRFLKKNVTFRKWKHMDMDKYRHDLANAHFELDNPVTDAVLCYNKILQDLSDKHAPIKSRCSIIRPHVEWFTPELLIEKREKRKLERNYQRTSSPNDAHCFKEH